MPSSDDAFNHLCGHLRPHEVQFALSRAAEKGWSPNQTTGIYSLRAPPRRPSCDATAAKLCIIDFISQHDESPDQQPARDRYFRRRMTSTQGDSPIDLAQLRIPPRRYLTRFHQQQT
jgi:hypothetical protein